MADQDGDGDLTIEEIQLSFEENEEVAQVVEELGCFFYILFILAQVF